MFVRKEIVHSFDIVLCVFVCDYSKQAVDAQNQSPTKFSVLKGKLLSKPTTI